MSFLAGSVIGTLGLETNAFTGGFLEASSLMQTFPSIVTSFMANPLLGLADLTKHAFSGIVSAIGSAFSFIKDAVSDSFHEADKLHDMATNAGVAVEALSGLGLAAEQSGSSTEAVAEAFKFLGKNVQDVADGNKAAKDSFSAIGVEATDAAGNVRPLEDVMFDVSDAMAAMPAGAARTGAAMSILGRSGTDLIATLSQGSAELKDQIRTFEDYGAVVSGKAANAADTFGDKIGELRIAWQGIKNILAAPIIEGLTPVLQGVLDWVKTHPGEIRQQMKLISDSVVKMATDVAQNMPQMSRAVVEACELMIQALTRLKATAEGLAIGTVAGGVLGGVVGGFAAGPAGIIPGIAIGTRVGGAAGAAIGYAAGGSSSPAPVYNVNVQPIDSGSSTTQLSGALQQGMQQAQRNYNQQREMERQRILIESGL